MQKHSGLQLGLLTCLLGRRDSVHDFVLTALDEFNAKWTGARERDGHWKIVSSVKLQQTGKRWRKRLSG
jgi:hypothetical protein